MQRIIEETINELSDIKLSEIKKLNEFEMLGFDNLDIAELVMVLEDKLQITATDDMFSTNSVTRLIEKIEKLNITVKQNII